MSSYYNKLRLLEYIQAYIAERNLKHEIYKFDSGYFMIDVWIDNKMYCVQLENNSAGLSIIEENTFDLSTRPDERFDDNYTFIKKFESLSNKK